MAYQTRFSKKDLQRIVPDCISYAQVLKRLGISLGGGNYQTLKSYIKMWDIDVSHFRGKSHNKGRILTPISFTSFRWK